MESVGEATDLRGRCGGKGDGLLFFKNDVIARTAYMATSSESG
jgi:hypothetical protein